MLDLKSKGKAKKNNDAPVEIVKAPKKIASKNSHPKSIESAIEALRTFRDGNLSARIPYDIDGMDKRVITLINEIFDQEENSFSAIKDLHSSVCEKGKTAERIIADSKGQWKQKNNYINEILDLNARYFENINELFSSIAKGILSLKIDVEQGKESFQGDYLKSAKTINSVIDNLNVFTSELARVTKEVGEYGKLDLKVETSGRQGIWKTLANNKNFLIANLTAQLRDVAKVAAAIEKGDLTQKITVDAKGEILTIKDAINKMMDNLRIFSSELARITKEVGDEGKLGIRIEIPGLQGIWKIMADNKNSLIANLTAQLRDVAKISTAIEKGDLTQKITVDTRGEIQGIKESINRMMDNLRIFSSELIRVTKEVGEEGKLGIKVNVPGLEGAWKSMADNKNNLIANLTAQLRDVAKVSTAIEKGDLTQKITVDVKGEILAIKETINRMMDNLRLFSTELVRVTREVGIEGKLGVKIDLPGLEGAWKMMADNKNTLIANLTDQLRDVSKVSTSIAEGNLGQKITVDVKGEILAIKNAINIMCDRLKSFTSGVTQVTQEVIKGNMSKTVETEAKGEFDNLKNNINEMIDSLRVTTEKNEQQNWLKSNLNKFSLMIQGQRDVAVVAKKIITELATVVGVQHGVFYFVEEPKIASEEPVLKLLASFAYKKRKELSNIFKFGEGLVGECALEKQRILITDVPADYIAINSGLGKARPYNIVVLPVVFEGKLKGVIELASFQEYSDIKLNFLDLLAESIGISIASIEANARTEVLLKESQTLTEELQAQQEELRSANEELENKTQVLQQSEEKLRAQQEELESSNEELEEKNQALEKQKTEIAIKNTELENIRLDIEQKAKELEISSKYKSEFLANMSHELRTPLNSLLILANKLSENKNGNLDDKQVESAKIIHRSGQDLLNLINDILDLSKIEAGKMSLNIESMELDELRTNIVKDFNHIAEQKNLTFSVSADTNCPPRIHTDNMRFYQIIKNLLSNAIKFTEQGGVSVKFYKPSKNTDLSRSGLNPLNAVAIAVTDTGIGIPKDKQLEVFEAFQQADGSTSRKFGGTGLGLSITRELVKLLGGEIKLESEEDKGSTFTVYLPVKTTVPPEDDSGDNKPLLQRTPRNTVPEKKTSPQNASNGKKNKEVVRIPDDRDSIGKNDSKIMIIEDDPVFAGILREKCNERGFKSIIAPTGEEGLELVRKYAPEAIVLDILLPGIDGWGVLEKLKEDISVRHIPVHIVSSIDQDASAFTKGAIGFARKPMSEDSFMEIFGKIESFLKRNIKKVLLVEDNKTLRMTVHKLLAEDKMDIIEAGTGAEAMKQLENNEAIDCVILDLGLPDISGFDLLDKLKKEKKNIPPIIIYTGKDLEPDEVKKLEKYSKSIIIKGVKSEERLIDEVSLFIHQIVKDMPEEKRKKIANLHEKDTVFSGKKIMIVDDDMRNVFALSGIIEEKGAHVIEAENGQVALDKLEADPNIDLIIMDIMMPVLDGYETMRRIRKSDKLMKIPIISLTAKAMPEDRGKCIEAGANDYLAKPINQDRLFSLMRAWLYR